MRRSVKKALEFWRGEGLLTADKVDELSARLADHEKGEDSGRAATIFGVIGAVLTGLGVILFVASNWAGMSPFARALVLIGGYGFVVLCAATAERKTLPMVADAVWLLATFVLGANIFLFGQIYNLSLTWQQGTLAWMIGALAMGYARNSAAQAALAVPLGLLTLGWWGGGSGWFFDDQMEFLWADGGLRPVLPLLGLALVAISTLVARREDLSFVRLPAFRWGTFLIAATLVITTIQGELAAAFFKADFGPKQLFVLVATTVLVAAAYFIGEFDSPRSRPTMAAILGGLVVMIIPVGGEPWLALQFDGVHLLFGLYVLVVFALALLTIWLGITASNARLVNVGMASTVLLIVIQYFGWSVTLMDRSVAFIVGGMVLIGLSTFVEKKRRQIMAQIVA